MDENGSSERRVRFGDLDNQSVPAEWVEPMLRHLFTHHKQAFAGCMMAAIDLHLPARGRKPVDAP